jgi:hypothetical protein
MQVQKRTFDEVVLAQAQFPIFTRLMQIYIGYRTLNKTVTASNVSSSWCSIIVKVVMKLKVVVYKFAA